MQIQLSAGNRLSVVALALISVLALAFSFGPASAGASGGGGKAVVAKKKCKAKGKSAATAKKKCKRKKDGGDGAAPVTPPATPAPLTAAEVINQVNLKAGQYCDEDPDCLDSGYYFDTGLNDPTCQYRTTYTWSCLGWNDEDFDENGSIETTCDFLEVVQRVGLNGVTSSQDLSFGIDGWDCYPI